MGPTPLANIVCFSISWVDNTNLHVISLLVTKYAETLECLPPRLNFVQHSIYIWINKVRLTINYCFFSSACIAAQNSADIADVSEPVDSTPLSM